jgi:hypothetical protein
MASTRIQDKITADLWRFIRESLALLQREYIALGKDPSNVVEGLQGEVRDWQAIGDQIRERETDNQDESRADSDSPDK